MVYPLIFISGSLYWTTRSRRFFLHIKIFLR